MEEEKEEEEKASLVRPGQVGWVNSEGVQEGWVNEGLLQGLVDLKIADLFLAGHEVPVQAPVQVGGGEHSQRTCQRCRTNTIYHSTVFKGHSLYI